MRLHPVALATAGFVVAAATVTSAQPQMPKPAPEMSQLSYFEGTWSCSGKMNETPVNPAGTMTTTVEIGKDLGGHWQSGVVKGSMPNMPPFEGKFYVTWDPAAKQYAMLWMDSAGAWARSMSPGWKGDTLVYEGQSHMGGQAMKTRDTFMRSGPDAMKHMWEMHMGGKWITGGEETCKKK